MALPGEGGGRVKSKRSDGMRPRPYPDFCASKISDFRGAYRAVNSSRWSVGGANGRGFACAHLRRGGCNGRIAPSNTGTADGCACDLLAPICAGDRREKTGRLVSACLRANAARSSSTLRGLRGSAKRTGLPANLRTGVSSAVCFYWSLPVGGGYKPRSAGRYSPGVASHGRMQRGFFLLSERW